MKRSLFSAMALLVGLSVAVMFSGIVYAGDNTGFSAVQVTHSVQADDGFTTALVSNPVVIKHYASTAPAMLPVMPELLIASAFPPSVPDSSESQRERVAMVPVQSINKRSSV